MNHFQEAVSEWTWAVGRTRPDQQWLLSDFDSWERNPHYSGPDQMHPEDYGYDDYEESYDSDNEATLTQITGTLED